MTFVTLAEAFDIAARGDADAFLYRIGSLMLEGKIGVTGYPAAIEYDPGIDRSTMFLLEPAARRQIQPFELADMRLSLAWGGIAYKGAPELLEGLAIVASKGAHPMALTAFTDLLFERAAIETHFRPGLDAVLLEAAGLNGGTLGQDDAFEVATDAGVYTNQRDIILRLKALKIEGKQGRKPLKK